MSQIPRHIAVIMDGNRRWAEKRRLSPIAGHRAGVESVRRVVRLAVEHRVSMLTLFAFSSENWKRPRQEVIDLLELIGHSIDKEIQKLHKRNIRVSFIGDLSGFDGRLRARLEQAEQLTAQNAGLQLVVALNYGGQWDVVQATQKMVREALSGQLSPEAISPALFQRYLSLGEGTEVDLLIRTSDEYRVSNFLLWHLAYSELFFTPALWPDFDEAIFEEALAFFRTRDRRYGGGRIGHVAMKTPQMSNGPLRTGEPPCLKPEP